MRARHAEKLKGKGRKDLAEVRVVQRNVVHVIGLTVNIAKADILRCPEFFGQYGKLLRVTVSKVPTQSKLPGSNQSVPVYSAYLSFEKPEDAYVAIQAVDGFAVDGHTLRANFGTTKYCRKFLDGEKCDRKDCNFLHKYVDENGHDKGGSPGKGAGKPAAQDGNGKDAKGGKGGKEGKGKDGKDGKDGSPKKGGGKAGKDKGGKAAGKADVAGSDVPQEADGAAPGSETVETAPAAAEELEIESRDSSNHATIPSSRPPDAAPPSKLSAPLPSGPPPQGPPAAAAPPLTAPPSAPPPQVSAPKTSPAVSPPSQPPSMPPTQPPTQPPTAAPTQAPSRPPPVGLPTGPPSEAPSRAPAAPEAMPLPVPPPVMPAAPESSLVSPSRRPLPPPLGAAPSDAPSALGTPGSPSMKGTLSLMAALTPSGPSPTPHGSPLAPPPAGVAPQVMAKNAAPSAPPSTPPSLPPSLPPSVPPSLPPSLRDGKTEPETSPQAQVEVPESSAAGPPVRSVAAALAAAAGTAPGRGEPEAPPGISVFDRLSGGDASLRGQGLGVFATGPGNHLEATAQVGKGSSLLTSTYSPQMQPAAAPRGIQLSVSDLFGGMSGTAPQASRSSPEEPEQSLPTPAVPATASAEALLKPPPPSTAQQLQYARGDSQPPVAPAAAAALQASQLQQHAARLAAGAAQTAGDRAMYDATRAAYMEQLNWAAYLEHESQRAAAYAQHYNGAYEATLQGYHAQAQAHYAAYAAAAAEAAGAGRPRYDQYLGLAGAYDAKGEHKRRGGGDAGDRSAPDSKANGPAHGMPVMPGALPSADAAEAAAGSAGGKDDGFELLQSLLPNTRINVTKPPGPAGLTSVAAAQAAQAAQAQAAAVAAAAAAGLRPGLGRGMPYGAAHPAAGLFGAGSQVGGLGRGQDPRADPRLLQALGSLLPDLQAAVAAAAAPKPQTPGPTAGSGWTPSLRPAASMPSGSMDELLQGIQPCAAGSIDGQRQPLGPGAINQGSAYGKGSGKDKGGGKRGRRKG